MQMFQGLMCASLLLVATAISRGDEPKVTLPATCCTPQECPATATDKIVSIKAVVATVPTSMLEKYCGKDFDGKPNNFFLEPKKMSALLAELEKNGSCISAKPTMTLLNGQAGFARLAGRLVKF